MSYLPIFLTTGDCSTDSDMHVIRINPLTRECSTHYRNCQFSTCQFYSNCLCNTSYVFAPFDGEVLLSDLHPELFL